MNIYRNGTHIFKQILVWKLAFRVLSYVTDTNLKSTNND